MLGLRNVILALACASSLASGAAALEGERRQITLHPVSGWAKVCSKDKATGRRACYTSRNFGADPRKPPVLALAIYDVEGDAVHMARFLMPVGLRTDLGLTFAVDGGEGQAGQFKICFQNGCFAEAKFGLPVLASMKRGGTMRITTTDGKNKRLDFYLSLAGLAAAYDGAGAEYRSIAPHRKGAPNVPGAPPTGATNI